MSRLTQLQCRCMLRQHKWAQYSCSCGEHGGQQRGWRGLHVSNSTSGPIAAAHVGNALGIRVVKRAVCPAQLQ